jgi:ABC-2 type transport system ATP-binding protein
MNESKVDGFSCFGRRDGRLDEAVSAGLEAAGGGCAGSPRFKGAGWRSLRVAGSQRFRQKHDDQAATDETLQFFGKLCGLYGAKLTARIDELIELVSLQNGRERPLRSYSKGMLQRIGLAQALIHDPDLLFLDEPTAGVDPQGSAQIRDLILRLKKMGKTVIFSSHLLEQVQEVADRVAIFSLGRKVLEGSLDELLAEKEATLVSVPGELTDARRAELERLLVQSGFAGANVQFSRPRLSLEQLYLRTVEAERKP